MKFTALLLTGLLLTSLPSFGQTSSKKGIGKTTEAIVITPFDEATPPTRKGLINGWQAGIGEWTVADGVLRGDELEENHHPSSCTFRPDATDLIIKAKFRLGTADQVAFGCRDTVAPNLHLGRTFISRDSIWIQHMSGIAKTTKAVKVGEKKVKLDPEAWYDLTIEIIGDHYRATVGDHVLEAHHDRFKDGKGIVALIVKGKGAEFKDVELWNAAPSGE